jgi:4-hydroxy-tetrahydrodipicolinate reductase
VKVAVVGHGKMGREVEAVLRERGHEPVIAARGAFPPDCRVGIDFTRAEAVPGNVAVAMAGGARYVVGTTGWQDRVEEVRRLVELAGGGLVHAPNFSLGVNLFYRLVREAAARLAPFPDYDP